MQALCYPGNIIEHVPQHTGVWDARPMLCGLQGAGYLNANIALLNSHPCEALEPSLCSGQGRMCGPGAREQWGEQTWALHIPPGPLNCLLPGPEGQTQLRILPLPKDRGRRVLCSWKKLWERYKGPILVVSKANTNSADTGVPGSARSRTSACTAWAERHLPQETPQ